MKPTGGVLQRISGIGFYITEEDIRHDRENPFRAYRALELKGTTLLNVLENANQL